MGIKAFQTNFFLNNAARKIVTDGKMARAVEVGNSGMAGSDTTIVGAGE